MPISATLPSEVRLIPARAGLNAVSALRERNLQAGTAIFNNNYEEFYVKKILSYLFLCIFCDKFVLPIGKPAER